MSDGNVSLTDMEIVVLGVVWRDGPCTAYHVRKEFSESPASFWSGSQGAIYPLLRKLDKKRLITSVQDQSDNRKAKLLTITADGKRQIADWYDPQKIASSVLREFDALRTRVFFLQVLNVKQKRAFFAHVEVELQHQETRALDRLKTEEDQINVLALRGLLACNRARQKWIKEVKQALLSAK